ncbi:hypothetical protein GBA52_024313, partial [Prunus armeniaca]
MPVCFKCLAHHDPSSSKLSPTFGYVTLAKKILLTLSTSKALTTSLKLSFF